jgi:imidazolonepropionase-like amidohydrolase
MTETAIFAGKLILGPAHHIIEDGGVLIVGDTIRAVGEAARIEQLARAETTRIEYPRATMLPGLIDCHVHLCFDSSTTPFTTLDNAGPSALRRMMDEHAQQLLHSGVTTARDLGDRDGLAALLREDIARGATDGPTLLSAGTPLTCPGGHCAFLGGEVSTHAEINDQIRRNKAAGADLVKVMASGGALTPTGPPMWAAQFTAAQLAHIVATAHGQQLPVAAHAHGTATIADCVAAGVSTIEHCSWRTEKRLAYDPDIARLMVERGVSVCRCVSGDWRLFLDQLGANAEPLVDSILAMRQTGVRLIAGTDAGVPGATFTDYAGMLSFFTEIGFSHTEVLDMATTHPAAALGLHNVGSIRPGYRADILLVEGDPTVTLDALRRPIMVVAAGRVYRPRAGFSHETR